MSSGLALLTSAVTESPIKFDKESIIAWTQVTFAAKVMDGALCYDVLVNPLENV